MPLSKREANKERCRQDILDAARELFKAKGYECTTIEEVADLAGVSKATLYNYFSNKDSLLLGLIDQAASNLQEYIHNKLDQNDRSIDKLKQTMVRLVLDVMPYISISRRILWLDAKADSMMYKKTVALKQLFEGLIDEAKAEGDIRKDLSTETIGDLLMGSYLVSQFQWVDINTLSEAECVERVHQIFDLTIKGCLTNQE